MAQWLNRDVPIDLTCPNCRHQFSKTLRELESDQKFPCPGCRMMFSPRNFKADLQAVEKKLDDFKRDLRKIFRNK